jgi:hypothetical protein
VFITARSTHFTEPLPALHFIVAVAANRDLQNFIVDLAKSTRWAPDMTELLTGKLRIF